MVGGAVDEQLDDLVAAAMPVIVVDLLEAVEIEQEEGDVAGIGVVEKRGRLGREGPAVVDAGQEVGFRQAAQGLLMPPAHHGDDEIGADADHQDGLGHDQREQETGHQLLVGNGGRQADQHHAQGTEQAMRAKGGAEDQRRAAASRRVEQGQRDGQRIEGGDGRDHGDPGLDALCRRGQPVEQQPDDRPGIPPEAGFHIAEPGEADIEQRVACEQQRIGPADGHRIEFEHPQRRRGRSQRDQAHAGAPVQQRRLAQIPPLDQMAEAGAETERAQDKEHRGGMDLHEPAKTKMT